MFNFSCSPSRTYSIDPTDSPTSITPRLEWLRLRVYDLVDRTCYLLLLTWLTSVCSDVRELNLHAGSVIDDLLLEFPEDCVDVLRVVALGALKLDIRPHGAFSKIFLK